MYNNKSWQKSTDFTYPSSVATSSNGKIVYLYGNKNDKPGLYSSKSSGKGHWTMELRNVQINTAPIAMSDKGDNIYFGSNNNLWRNRCKII